MTQKEKLIEVLSRYFTIGDSYEYSLLRVKSAFAIGTMSLEDFVEFDDEKVADIADYLLDNGVVVLPCKVGDTVYYLSGTSKKMIKSAEVEEITTNDSSWCVLVCPDTFIRFNLQEDEVYFTREEAEAALKKMEDEK